MENRYVIIVLLFFSGLSIYSQDKSIDFSLFTKENIEFEALKPFFYLIRQEYVVIDGTGKTRVRGGNDFYGKAYTIGVLTGEPSIKFPTYIRTPWKIDNTYDKLSSKNYKPECSLIGWRSFADTTFFKTKLQDIEQDDILTSIMLDSYGIPIEESQRDNGTLIVFYSKAASYDDFSVISHLLIPLDEINWNSEGFAESEELNLGDNRIIGGVLFSRYINPGEIKWKLSGFYLPVDTKWILKSVINQ